MVALKINFRCTETASYVILYTATVQGLYNLLEIFAINSARNCC